MSLIDFGVFQTLILMLTALACYYIYYLKVIATYWAKRGIPHVPPKFIIGDGLKAISLPVRDVFNNYYRMYKNSKVIGFWSFHIPVLAVFDREIIKSILISDFSTFHDRFPMTLGDHDYLLSGALFNMRGRPWRNMRVKLTPAFTSGKMKMLYSTMTECGAQLQNILKNSCENGNLTIDVHDLCSRYTTDIIASSVYGIEANSLKNPDSEFRVHGKAVFNPTAKQLMLNIMASLLPYFGTYFKISQLPSETNDFFVRIVEETMEYRKKNNIKRNDFMELLIELKNKGRIEDVDGETADGAEVDVQPTKFSVQEAASQAFLFFAAGFETSAMTMTLALYELAENEQIQSRLRTEIKLALQSEQGILSYEKIQKLDYLDWVVQETLRKYPTAPMLMRQSSKDHYVPELGVTIPKNTLIFIPICGLTQDPEFFQDPEKFDPSRFSPERKQEIPSYCHIPFGEGPRNCIGNRFALLQTKVGLTSILKECSVEKSELTPKSLIFAPKALTLSFKDGLHLRFRSDSLPK